MSFIQREPIYIIIPVHNRKNTTLKCLENLQKSGDVQKYYIVVVDDGSTDGTSQAIQSLYPEVTILQGDGNLWWTGGIKKGMEYAYQQGAEYFIWLNDDCLVTEKTLSDSIEFCKKNPNSIVGCQGFEEKDNTTLAFGGKYQTWKGYNLQVFPKDKVSPCGMLSGNLVIIPRKTIDLIGFPEPNLLPHYGGDTLFLIRARKAGYNLFVDTRHSLSNISGEPKLAPNRWLFKDGHPLVVFNLLFTPQSLLHWKVWFWLAWEDYFLLGILIFIANYLRFILIPVLMVSLLRYLPLSTRNKLSSWKKQIITSEIKTT
jgi:glycosyltransferase involved in cell wall biosynthesis